MMSLAYAAELSGARHVGADAALRGVSTDTRSIGEGTLFIALRGERFDGHDFVLAARDKGATAAMVDERAAPGLGNAGLPLAVVGDTRGGLQRLAAGWRRRFTMPLVAITGSNGKTTVKEMTAAILRARDGAAGVLATEGNLNNDIGLPLTLLRLRAEHRSAVVELGMNHRGETDLLAQIARPTVAVINNAQREHQEFMQSVDEVALEHADVLASLASDGIAVIHADDPHAPMWRERAGARRVIGFGESSAAEVHADVAGTGQSAGGQAMVIDTPLGRVRLTLSVPGAHNARNALAATAAAIAAGAGLEAVVSGLEGFRAVRGRMQVRAGRGGARLIDDTYNANPDSVRAAIDALSGHAGRRVLVLGDMGEVGEQGPAFHEEVGRHARERGIERLLCTGELSRHAAGAFGAPEHFSDIGQVVDALAPEMRAGTAILVKGSRFMRMERVVAALEAAGGEGA